MFGFLTKRIPAEETQAYRVGLVMILGFSALERDSFEKPEWTYFFEDVAAEAKAARLTLPANRPADFITVIRSLSPYGIQRLYAAYCAYTTPLGSGNEAKLEATMRPLRRTEIERIRERRAAVQALAAESAKLAAARETALRQYASCPRGRTKMTPSAFCSWIGQQTPDTWHVVLAGWDYGDDRFDAALAFILESQDCDAGTAAQFFFLTAAALADEDPAKLRGFHRSTWLLMKNAADRWLAGYYARAEFSPAVDRHTVAGFDQLAAERNLPFAIPAAADRIFGGRAPQSHYAYEGGGRVAMDFDLWLKSRAASEGCGQNFPACCKRAKVSENPASPETPG